MMVRAKVTAGEMEEEVGEFDFASLPRQGDEIVVPCGDDVRIFIVKEVSHRAAGADRQEQPEPSTWLRYCEEIH